jgi:DNA-binding transcriptional ArsR family regulator
MADESVFRALAHPARRRVLDMLRRGERPVADVVQSFRLSKQAVSQHLRILRTSGLVRQRRSGRGRIYWLEAAKLRDVARWIAPYQQLF